MKKKISAVLAMALAVSILAGCGGKSGSKKTKTSMDIEYKVNDYVTLCDYSALDVTLVGNFKTDDEAVNNYMLQIIQSSAPLIKDDSQTTVQADSIVNVDYVGKKDGVAFDHGSAQGANIDVGNNCDAVQGTGFIDGFTSGLVGKNVGEVVDCDVTFPEDYGNADLAGQAVVFTFTINYIGTKATVENITDEYVSTNFGMASVDEFRAKVAEEQAAYVEEQKKQETRNQVIAAMRDKCTVKFPEGVVGKRLEEYIDRYKETHITDKKQTLEDYLKENYNSTLEDFKKDAKSSIEENLKTELIFQAVAEKEGIELDKKEFDQYVENLMTRNGVEKKSELYKLYAPTEDSGKAYLERIYVANKACDKIVETANVTEQAADDEGEGEAQTDTQE